MDHTTNSSGENIEEISKSKKINSSQIAGKAYKEFVSHGIKSGGVKFINKYYSKSDSDTSFKDEFMNFIDTRGTMDEEFLTLGNDFKNQMSLGKIKALLGSEFIKFQNNRKSLKSYVLQFYDVSSENYDKKIAGLVGELELGEIQELIGNRNNIDDFLKDKNIKGIKRRDLNDFLRSFRFDERIKKMPKEKREQLEEVVDFNLIHLDPVSPHFVDKLSGILSSLFTEGILNKTEKEEILSVFMPFVSLRKAKDTGLMSKARLEQYILKNELQDIGTAGKDEMLSKMYANLEDILIPTHELVGNDEKKILNIVRNDGFKKIASEIQKELINISKNGVSTFGELQFQLAQLSKVSGISDMKKGAIIEMKTKRNGKDEATEYYEIFATDSSSGATNIMSYQNKGGNGTYLPNLDASLEKETYSDFLDLINNEAIVGLQFFDKKNFEKKISIGSIEENIGTFTYLSPGDKQVRKERHSKDISKKLIEDRLMSEGDDLSNVIEDLEDNTKQKYQEDITAYTHAENINQINLLNQVDASDTDGKKYNLDAGTTFVTKNGSGSAYTILSVEDDGLNGKIKLIGIGGKEEELSFENFYYTFVEKKCKRTSKVASIENLFESVNEDEQLWGSHEIKSGKIINKTNSKNEYKCDFLAASDGESTFLSDFNVLQLESLGESIAKVRLGTIKKGKEKTVDTVYSMSDSIIEIPLGVLSLWAKKAGLIPQNLEEEGKITEEMEGKDKMYNSLWSKYINNFANISTLIEVGKNYIEFFDQYLKEGRNEQAARILSKLPVLTAEQRSAAITHLENAEKKRMDDYLEKLKIRDSGEATDMIEKRILNKDSVEAQKEAALFYMIEKYGVLYEKNALIQHKGDWLWYKALGGSVNPPDELFIEQKEYAEKYGIQFTEEDLVYLLLAKQCKGRLQPKRRGKLYKEYEAIIGKGLADEIEKGKKDAEKKRTPEQREKFAIEEAIGGGWPNSFGAMEALVGKGFDGDIAKLNSIPFVLMTSGAAYSFAPGKADQFKNGMVPTQFFTGKASHVKIFNDTIIELTKDIEEKLGGEYTGMHKQFKELIQDGIGLDANKKRKKLNEGERIAYSHELFKGKWGDTLSRALLMLNTRKTDQEAEFETWTRFHSDNSTYASYNEIFDGGIEATKDSRFQNKDLLKDGFKMHEGNAGTGGMSGFSVYETAKEFIQPINGGYGFRDKDLGLQTWKEITLQIDAIVDNEAIDENYKRERIAHTLRGLMDAMAEIYGQNKDSISRILENPGDILHAKFKQWGVSQGDWNRGNGTFRERNFNGADETIEKYVDNIMKGQRNSTDTQKFKLGDIRDDISYNVSKTVNNQEYGTQKAA